MVKTIKLMTTACAVYVFAVGAAAWGQTFQVVNQASSVDFFSTLDATYTLSFDVQLSSNATLTNVVPELLVPACVSAQGRPLFETTFRGQPGGSTTDLAVASWGNGQTKTLTFYVHLYRDAIMCNDALTACNANNFSFDMQFTHTGTSTPIMAADPSNHLNFAAVPDDAMAVVDIHSMTPAGLMPTGQCERYFTPTWTILLQDYSFNLQPGQRVLLGCNWRLGTDPTDNIGAALGLFDYPTSISTRFPLTDRLLDGSLSMMPESTFLTDATGQVLGTAGSRFQMAPLGGSVPTSGQSLDCSYQSWNFFDITDMPLAGQTVKDIIGALDTNNKIQGTTSREITYFRQAGLFIADDGGCDAALAFYNSPSNFQFTGMHFKADGTVDVSVSVPTAWTNGQPDTLGSNYTIEWFYKDNRTFKKANVTGQFSATRSLNQTISFPYTNPSDFRLEARIRHVPSNSYVSVDSPRHNLGYAGINAGNFANAEANPDEFLDPGESYIFPATLSNLDTSGSVNNLMVTLGPTGNASVGVRAAVPAKMSGPMAFGPGVVYNGSVPAGGQLSLDLEYFLISAPQCEDAEFDMVFTYTNGSFTTSYTQTFVVPANCEYTPQVISLGQSGWSDMDCFGTPTICPDSNCSSFSCEETGHGWSYSNGAWAGTSATFAYFHSLTGPAIASPRNPALHMRHTAAFPLLAAGGIVEYREFFDGSGWSAWQDAILPLENQHDVALYHPRVMVVDNQMDQMVAGRRVFMSGSLDDWNYTFPSNQFTGDLLQFRLLFQKGTRDFTSSGTWTVEEFDFSGELPNEDNIFGINGGSFSGCLTELSLNPTTPGNYTYYFHAGIDSLLSGVADHISMDGSWPSFPPPVTDTTYYARVIDNTDNTERLVDFLVESANGGVPQFGVVTADWRNPGATESTDIDQDGLVTVKDLILQIELDTCNL